MITSKSGLLLITLDSDFGGHAPCEEELHEQQTVDLWDVDFSSVLLDTSALVMPMRHTPEPNLREDHDRHHGNERNDDRNESGHTASIQSLLSSAQQASRKSARVPLQSRHGVAAQSEHQQGPRQLVAVRRRLGALSQNPPRDTLLEQDTFTDE